MAISTAPRSTSEAARMRSRPRRLTGDRMCLPLPGSGSFRPALRLIDPLEPKLAPVGINTPRAEEAIPAQASTARYTIKDKTVAGDVRHRTGLFVDEPLYTTENTKGSAAKRHHLDIK